MKYRRIQWIEKLQAEDERLMEAYIDAPRPNSDLHRLWTVTGWKLDVLKTNRRTKKPNPTRSYTMSNNIKVPYTAIFHIPTMRWAEVEDLMCQPAQEEYKLNWQPVPEDDEETRGRLAALAMMRTNGIVEGVGIVMRLEDVPEYDGEPDTKFMKDFPRWYASFAGQQGTTDKSKVADEAFITDYMIDLGKQNNGWGESNG